MVNLKKAQMANARCGNPNVVCSRAGFLAEFTIFVSQEMRSRTQMQRLSGFFNNKIKHRTKTTPKGKNKQAGRQTDRRLEHSQM